MELKTGAARTCLLLAATGAALMAGQTSANATPPGPFLALVPASGAVLETPLTCILRWSASEGAQSYTVTLKLAGQRAAVLRETGIRGTTLRVPVRPETDYEWSVKAVAAGGERTAAGSPLRFRTPAPRLQEISDPLVMFAGWRPGAHFVGVEPMPTLKNAPLSPWYWKKSYDQAPPPTFEQARPALPVPIWDGHDDAIGMYWYAWKTLFGTWLYPPPDGPHFAVSNLLGFPTWAGWGSTMVWDSAFILQFTRYGHWAYPVITSLDNCYARQHENGFICRETENHNIEVNSSWPVNLPLLAWAEWSTYSVTGDAQRIQQVLLPLVKQYEWYLLYQRLGNGFYWSRGMGDGMDDSPRNALAHSNLAATSIMAFSAEILAQMSVVAGRGDMASWFDEQHAEMAKEINAAFWDDDHSLYNDLGTDGKPITRTSAGLCKHAFVFWPMLCGVAGEEQARDLAAHLRDERSFNVPSGIASLSLDSEGYNRENGSYWRGSVWPPTEYMALKGLDRCGQRQIARELALKYHGAFLQAYLKKGDITEFLAPERPEMHGCEKFVGWGGLAPIAILFEDIFGLRVDGASERIDWYLECTERHGVQNLRFGDRTVSLVCDARQAPDAPGRISVESDGEFELVVHIGDTTTKRRIKAGATLLGIGEPES